MYQKFLFAKCESTDLHRQFVKRFAAQLTAGEFRSAQYGGWQASIKTNVKAEKESRFLEHHHHRISQFLHGWEDGKWLTANGYTISDEVDTIRANRIAQRGDESVLDV